MPNIDSALKEITSLVEDFQNNESHYRSASYSEAQARIDFIDKFWIALGWDVNHYQQTNPYEQEVKVERTVATGGSQRRADYAFYLMPNFHEVRFFVEAKKPSVDIETAENYFQVIRYGWNSETPLAVLTDFEQFHVLDCRYRPDIETALNRSVAKYHYTDYLKREKLAEIYWLFSREAVADGSIAKRAKELPKPRGKAVQRGLFPGGYQSIDDSFLAALDEYRTALARAFKNRNPELDSETLTEISQRTLDRLVFLRFLEDKGIEAERRVELFGTKGTVWKDFIAASRRLDGIYNGIVYKRHDILDSAGFQVDDVAFANICQELAHINSPYDFNAIPIHILGSIYERFLGKVIVATAKRARVEEKPEVRKAGGVYYTPEYIVRYIVENTVGKLIAGKTPAQIAKMRFADISCGSGSFLLGVFDLLLKYHGQYYNSNPTKSKKGDCVKRNGRLYLSLSKKREIMLNNIYGVDIDSQAVEVCQLSLYLKLLEEETEASTHQYLLDFEHTAKMKQLLPDLSKNIVCGNSLIGRDILDGHLFPGDEERKLNPMDFEDAFPDIMKRGGFDAIVGNPPYGAEIGEVEKRYLRNKHSVSIADTAALFILHQQLLLKTKGLGSFIVPKPLLYNSNWSGIRESILPETQLVCDCERVWPEVKLEQVIYLIEKSTATPSYISAVRREQTFEQIGLLNKKHCSDFGFILSNVRPNEIALALKLRRESRTLGDIVKNQRGAMLQGSVTQAKAKMGVLGGKQIRRYAISVDLKGYATRRQVQDNKAFVQPNSVLAQNIVAHIRNPVDHIQITATVASERMRGKSVILDTVNQLVVRGPWSNFFVLGILNSKLINWFVYRFIFACAIRTMHFDTPVTDRIPLCKLAIEMSEGKALHDKMVSLVEAMLEAKKHLAKAKIDKEKTYYENKCAALDQQIDRLVYELYDLTEEEIEIVEEET